MADPPVHATDAAICRLLADGPLPTAAIAARLAIPERTARHRLRQLRRSGVVVTGTDGLHRLAAPAGADLAAADVVRDHPASGAPSGEDDGHWTVIALLAVVGIGLAAALVSRRAPPPPSPPAPPWGFTTRAAGSRGGRGRPAPADSGSWSRRPAPARPERGAPEDPSNSCSARPPPEVFRNEAALVRDQGT